MKKPLSLTLPNNTKYQNKGKRNDTDRKFTSNKYNTITSGSGISNVPDYC